MYPVIFLLFFLSCQTEPQVSITTDLASHPIIPQPQSVQSGGKALVFNDEFSIYVPDDSEEMERIGNYLAAMLRPLTGFEWDVKDKDGQPKKEFIHLTNAANDQSLGEEGYLLDISEEGISIKANRAAGVFRGIQTLRQILPDSIELGSKHSGSFVVPTGTIRDFPSYSYRGSMLDVSRHFFSVEDVKRYIDLISFYKMNILHLHLADDQGWRIEIKSWPNLAKHGGSTQVGGGKGGYYTQEQFSDIVNYANERYITIIPEIDMPGHTNAALSSYPELNCNNKAPELYTGMKVGFSSLCVRKDITYKFIDDVVKEIAALTPGPYIHLGGDESHATKKEDYIYFVNKVQPIVAKYGKTMIGWEEIAQANLQPGTVVQLWANPKHAQLAVSKGAKIIMSPAKKIYLDMKYDSATRIGLKWAAMIEIDSSYSWDPARYVSGISRENILGIEAPLWTETVETMNDIEYLVFPRLPGIAEIGWSNESSRNWDEYRVRLGKHGRRMDMMGIDYYKSRQIDWK